MNDDKNNKSSNTIQNAIVYVDTPADNLKGWRQKDLGLQFLLFGIAERQAKRVANLMDKVLELEDQVFDPDNMRELDPIRSLNLYKTATDNIKEATDYIAKTRKEMDWNSIQAQLAELTMTETSKPTITDFDIAKIANRLLNSSSLKAEDKTEEDDQF